MNTVAIDVGHATLPSDDLPPSHVFSIEQRLRRSSGVYVPLARCGARTFHFPPVVIYHSSQLIGLRMLRRLHIDTINVRFAQRQAMGSRAA